MTDNSHESPARDATDSTGLLAEARRVEAAGDPVGALDLMLRANQLNPQAETTIALIQARHRAAEAIHSEPRSPWPPAFEDPFPDCQGIPEIEPSDLDVDTMGGAIEHHGSLIVRGLFDSDRVARTRASIDRAIESRLVDVDVPTDQHYYPQLGLGGFDPGLRKRISENGLWLVDSPSATAQVLEDLEAVGVTALVRDYFQERPVISLQKCTLRRVNPEYRFTAWHQDGSFLGEQTRALNVWVALTACGGERPSPGMELVAGRVPVILDAPGGTGRASIDGMAVHYQAKATGLEVVRPEFDPGDALVFDELMTHRTYLSKTMTTPRDALECWFFSPAFPADEYESLLV